VLDDAGRILTYAESEKGKQENLPSDPSVTIRALAIHGLSEALPGELGKVKFTTVVSDKYRLVTIDLAGRIVMFALPLSVSEDAICNEAIKKWGLTR
jgi:hypothetical protein